MTCYRGFLLGSCRRVAGGRAAVLRGPGAGGPAARPRLCGDGGGRRHLGQGQPRELAGCGSRPDGGFRPSRVVVVAKTTRYEFEQQRYRYAELSEEDLKQLVGPGASPSLLCADAAPVHSQARSRLRGVARPLGTTLPPRRPRCPAFPARCPLLPLASLVDSSLSVFVRRERDGGERDRRRERVTVIVETPKTGEKDLEGGTGAPSGKGLGIHLCAHQPHPLFSLSGRAATAPRKVGGWLRSGRSGNRSSSLPQKRGSGAWLREVAERALVPRTHPLLLCRTARPEILRKAGLSEPFP